MQLTVSLLGANTLSDINRIVDLCKSKGITKFETTMAKLNLVDVDICSVQSIAPVHYNILESQETVRKFIRDAYFNDDVNIVFGMPRFRNLINHNSEELFIGLCKVKKFAIEPCSKIYGTIFLNTFNEVYNFIKDNKLENTTINLDLGNCITESTDLSKILNKKTVKYISHVHISAPELKSIREQDFKYYAKAVKLLKKYGYDGYISLESLDMSDDEINYFIDKFTPLVK